jgi:hypothetical protein
MVEMAENECVLSDSEWTAAIEMLRAIITDEERELMAPTGPATVYTTSITIWMLILQRPGKGKTTNEQRSCQRCAEQQSAIAA